MAYGVFIAAVSPDEVQMFRADPSRLPVPRVIASITHLAAYWIKVQPLGSLLAEAIDGGEDVASALWHPLRPPGFHQPQAIKQIRPRLTEAWALAERPPVAREVPWFRYDVDAILENFGFAAENDLGVITALDDPLDRERAGQVLIPLASRAPQPGE